MSAPVVFRSSHLYGVVTFWRLGFFTTHEASCSPRKLRVPLT
jgi:hypothetical protein